MDEGLEANIGTTRQTTGEGKIPFEIEKAREVHAWRGAHIAYTGFFDAFRMDAVQKRTAQDYALRLDLIDTARKQALEGDARGLEDLTRLARVERLSALTEVVDVEDRPNYDFSSLEHARELTAKIFPDRQNAPDTLQSITDVTLVWLAQRNGLFSDVEAKHYFRKMTADAREQLLERMEIEVYKQQGFQNPSKDELIKSYQDALVFSASTTELVGEVYSGKEAYLRDHDKKTWLAKAIRDGNEWWLRKLADEGSLYTIEKRLNLNLAQVADMMFKDSLQKLDAFMTDEDREYVKNNTFTLTSKNAKDLIELPIGPLSEQDSVRIAAITFTQLSLVAEQAIESKNLGALMPVMREKLDKLHDRLEFDEDSEINIIATNVCEFLKSSIDYNDTEAHILYAINHFKRSQGWVIPHPKDSFFRTHGTELKQERKKLEQYLDEVKKARTALWKRCDNTQVMPYEPETLVVVDGKPLTCDRIIFESSIAGLFADTTADEMRRTFGRVITWAHRFDETISVNGVDVVHPFRTQIENNTLMDSTWKRWIREGDDKISVSEKATGGFGEYKSVELRSEKPLSFEERQAAAADSFFRAMFLGKSKNINDNGAPSAYREASFNIGMRRDSRDNVVEFLKSRFVGNYMETRPMRRNSIVAEPFTGYIDFGITTYGEKLYYPVTIDDVVNRRIGTIIHEVKSRKNEENSVAEGFVKASEIAHSSSIMVLSELPLSTEQIKNKPQDPRASVTLYYSPALVDGQVDSQHDNAYFAINHFPFNARDFAEGVGSRFTFLYRLNEKIASDSKSGTEATHEQKLDVTAMQLDQLEKQINSVWEDTRVAFDVIREPNRLSQLSDGDRQTYVEIVNRGFKLYTQRQEYINELKAIDSTLSEQEYQTAVQRVNQAYFDSCMSIIGDRALALPDHEFPTIDVKVDVSELKHMSEISGLDNFAAMSGTRSLLIDKTVLSTLNSLYDTDYPLEITQLYGYSSRDGSSSMHTLYPENPPQAADLDSLLRSGISKEQFAFLYAGVGSLGDTIDGMTSSLMGLRAATRLSTLAFRLVRKVPAVGVDVDTPLVSLPGMAPVVLEGANAKQDLEIIRTSGVLPSTGDAAQDLKQLREYYAQFMNSPRFIKNEPVYDSLRPSISGDKPSDIKGNRNKQNIEIDSWRGLNHIPPDDLRLIHESVAKHIMVTVAPPTE